MKGPIGASRASVLLLLLGCRNYLVLHQIGVSAFKYGVFRHGLRAGIILARGESFGAALKGDVAAAAITEVLQNTAVSYGTGTAGLLFFGLFLVVPWWYSYVRRGVNRMIVVPVHVRVRGSSIK